MTLKNIVLSISIFFLGFSTHIHTGILSKETLPPVAQLPIVYDPGYNLSFFGIEKLHAFDTQKYKHIVENLQNHGLDYRSLTKPIPVTRDQLHLVHSPAYIKAVESASIEVFKIAEMPAFLGYVFPASVTYNRILKPMLLATGGTIQAAQLALKHGWAINLSGGYHHAKAKSGEGFCVYADIPIAINVLWQNNPKLKVMVIDLDAHQGNGVSSILKKDPRTYIIDVYNAQEYPQDYHAEIYVNTHGQLPAHTRDKTYLATMQRCIQEGLAHFKPDIIFYNAGTDIYEKDWVGNLKVSHRGIIQRDEYVFSIAQQHTIPIVMTLSGGYTKTSATIVADSICNLALKNLIAIPDLVL